MTGGPSQVSSFAADALRRLDEGDLAGVRQMLIRMIEVEPGHFAGWELANSVAKVMYGGERGTVEVMGSRSATLSTQTLAPIPQAHSTSTETSSAAYLMFFTRQPPEAIAAALKPAREVLTRCTWVGSSILNAEELGIEALPTGPSVYHETRSSFRAVLTELLARQAAKAYAAERTERRLMIWATRVGMTQRQIAAGVGKPQTFVHRQLRSSADDPSASALSPHEIFEHFVAGEIERTQMLAMLAAYPYDSGAFPDDARESAYVPGSYDELVTLVARGSISDEEFELILSGIEALRETP